MPNDYTTGARYISTSVLPVSNRRSDQRNVSFDPIQNAESYEEAAKGLNVFQKVLNTRAGQHYLWDFRPTDMIERNVTMVNVKHGNQVVGTMQFNRDKESKLWFRAAAVLPQYSGMQIASAMGCVGLFHDAVMHLTPPTEIVAAIRQMPNGSLNEASQRSIFETGFHP